jgi:uncharacterized protein (DUF2336 family)
LAHDFAQPEYLYRLAKGGSSQDRESLAQAVTSLLRSQLTEVERSLAQDILLRLLEEAETDLRLSLAQQLAREPECPQVLLDFLIYKNDFSIAEPVLRYSTVLTDEYLIEVVKHFDHSDYWRTIARRRHIGEDLATILMGTDDEEVIELLVTNPNTDLSAASMEWLVGLAPNWEELHEPLLLRPEVTPELAARIYWHVSESLRTHITRKFDIDQRKLDKAMDRIVKQKMAQKYQVLTITPAMLDLSIKMKQQNKITSRQILDAAKRSDSAFFICLWAALVDINKDILLEKMRDDFVMTLAVLCQAARITRSDYNEMFMIWRRINQGSVMSNAGELTSALSTFDGMTYDKARHIIQVWNGDQTTTRQ